MMGNSHERTPSRAWKSLRVMSLLSIGLAVLFLFIWNIPYASTVQVPVRWDELWRNSLYKQISGFTAMALMALGLLLTLQKRTSKMKWGDYSLWRLSHAVFGTLTLIALIVHTGLRTGSELNLILMMSFILLALVGANAGSVIAGEHRMAVGVAKKQRTRWTWLHIMLTWPLPVLLGFHVIKTYYF